MQQSPISSLPLGLTVLGMLQARRLQPYRIQRLVKKWGKDQVVNVSQRATPMIRAWGLDVKEEVVS